MNCNHQRFIEVKKTIKLQFILGICAVILISFFRSNQNSIISAVIGVFLVTIPTLIYVKIAFARGFIAYPNIALAQHQKAMLFRFFLNLVLFMVVAVVYRGCDFLALFTTYFITLSGYWFSLIKK